VTSQRPPFAYLDHVGPIPFAHRGGTSSAPENSIEAFANAVALGYRYLETDAHLTSDGVIVSFHDTKLDRVTDTVGAIRDLTWARIAQATLHGEGMAEGVTAKVPQMAELFDRFPEARFNIDAKSDDVVEPLAQFIIERNAVDRVCVGSFSDARLQRIRTLVGPKLCTSAGPRETAKARALSLIRRPTPSSPPLLQVPIKQSGVPIVDRALVTAAHKAGVQVHVWTIDDPAVMEHLLDLGVDGIMTDQPVVLRQVLERRGQWNS
jgi:glycerophosphoryl diester phosphodiesterase